MKLQMLINKWILENHRKTEILEEQFFQVNELKIDELNSYRYKDSTHQDVLGYNKAWEFEDRCGNLIVAVYIESNSEFKTGFRVPEVSTLVFDPKKLPQDHRTLGNLQQKIKPCPDDKRINTVYKILVQEVIPNYVLNKKPNKLFFNSVSKSRERLVGIVVNRTVKQCPQLIKKDTYIVHK